LIRAMIFDLDGTLVQTEKLKSLAYAQAAIKLKPELKLEQVSEAFKDVVGLSRREVSRTLLNRFALEEPASRHMGEFGVSTPWQAYTQLRLQLYREMVADPEIVRANVWPHNLALLEEARRTKCKVGLATMSYCQQVSRILYILNLQAAFDFVASRDDVERAKPNPEIYLLVAEELEVQPENCLVIEDSPGGVRAALAAQMHCIAVTTPLTKQVVSEHSSLDPRWIVDDASRLPAVAQQLIKDQS